MTMPKISNISVLIVDDNNDFRSTLTEYFSDKGYDVTGAENGKVATSLFVKHHYDLVLLDLNMPIMDGLETLKQIKSRSDDTHIIIMTGKADPEKYFFYKEGCILFEKKPVDIIELEYKIKNILQSLSNKKMKSIPENTFIELDVNAIYDFIIENIENFNLNADLIADSLGVNKKKMYDRIGEVLTITLHEMIKNIRLYKAYELIRINSVITIRELSSSVGYSDAGYFTKVFERAFGIKLKNEISKRGYKLKIRN